MFAPTWIVTASVFGLRYPKFAVNVPSPLSRTHSRIGTTGCGVGVFSGVFVGVAVPSGVFVGVGVAVLSGVFVSVGVGVLVGALTTVKGAVSTV